MSIRPTNIKDISAIASIHKVQFPSHFLGQYSTSLLSEFYRSFLGKSLFLVHDTVDGVNGFVLGGTANQISAGKVAFVHDNLMHCVGETLLNPRLWSSGVCRGVLALTDFQSKRCQGSEFKSGTAFTLLSIAVSKEAVGKGVAIALMNAFEKQILGGVSEYRLSVDKDNHRSLAFFRKMRLEVIYDSGDSVVFRRAIASYTV